jgi:NADH-ubiquinone oxidoreductase chain 1
MTLVHLIQYIDFDSWLYLTENGTYTESLICDPLTEGLLCSLTLGIKTMIMIFIFIWTRASFPRIRFDQLMSFSWTILLPLVIAFIILVPCILYSFDILPSNFVLL